MRVVLYSRAGCHLCDDARAVLLAEQARSPFDLEEIDIEPSDELLREYGVRIPVVEIDGVESLKNVFGGGDRQPPDVDERPDQSQPAQMVVGVIGLVAPGRRTRRKKPFTQIELDRRDGDAAALT